MPHDKAKKIIFIHIPKTAGSSIEEALELTEMRSPNTFPSPQHFIASEVKGMLDFWHTAFTFSVVREPYFRTVSEFLWRLTRKALPTGFPKHLTNSEASFNTFLQFVKDVVMHEDYSLPTYDHFRPQAEFLDEKLDEIFCFEKLGKLERHFGVKLPKLNVSILAPNQLLSDRNTKLIEEVYWQDFGLLV